MSTAPPMKADLFILQICDFLDDGDGHYRLHEPSRQLARLPGVVVVDCHFYHRLLPALVDAADVLILPFVHDWDFFPVIERRRSQGRVTVFEANDYFYDVQPWNAVGAPWQDRAIQDEYRLYMAATDAVQTSTPELARRWMAWARRVAVFVNHLAVVPPLAEAVPRPLTVGWGGSPGHFADWYHVAPLLEGWLQARPDVHLAVMTNEFAKPFVRLPAERYHFTPFGSLSTYLHFLQTLDIGLAPLLPSEYNRCRSDVKFLEYAAYGVAGIYADLEPYRGTVRHGETGLLYRDGADLLRCLDRLADEAALRRRIRLQAHDYVVRERQIADHVSERLDFYRGLLPAPPRGADVPAAVLADAVRDGNYLQLRPGEAEKAVLAAAGPATRDSCQNLARVLDRHPDYLAALQQQGRLLNDLRDHRAALALLERVLAHHPASARTLCEIGRARYLLGDVAGARHALERTLEINPLYLPGWQYLLRFLELSRSPDGATWADRAVERFPENYQLGLAAARARPAGDVLPALGRLLDVHGPRLVPDERPSAAATFSQALTDMAGPRLTEAAVLPVLARAVELFPESARLLDLYGHALRFAGRQAEALVQHERALQQRRSALLFRSEYPQEDGSLHYWQFAEHVRRWTK